MKLSRPDISAWRIGGAILILSTALMFTGAAVANFTLSVGETAFGGAPQEVMEAIALNPSLWRLAEVLILVAIVLTALGLVPITLAFKEEGRTWANVGLVTFCISALLGAIRRIISISIDPWVATEGIDLKDPVVEAFSRFGEAMGEWFTLSAFAAIAFYGFAMRRTEGSAPVGSLFVAGSGLGIILHLIGAGIPAFIFLGTGTLGVVVIMGFTVSFTNEH